MAEIGILGRRERAGTFSALGVRPYYAETARQAQEAFERMMKEECAIRKMWISESLPMKKSKMKKWYSS